MSVHPFHEPFGTALIQKEGTVRGISDVSNHGHGDIAEQGDFFSGKHPPGAGPGEVDELFMIELHSDPPRMIVVRLDEVRYSLRFMD